MPNHDPQLTIVVPVYNRGRVVERTLDSLAAQSLRPLSIIIINNNSTDDTAGILERWATARRSPGLDITLASERCPGAAAARNRGLSLVATPLTMFFDSDDYMEPWLAQSVVERFNREPHVDIVGWDLLAEQADGTYRKMTFTADGTTVYRAIVHGLMSTARYAARTELFRRAGGWDPSVRVWDDMELSLRMLALDPSIDRLECRPAVITTYSSHSITADADRLKVNPAKEHALDLCEKTMQAAQCQDALKWIDYRRAILAAEYAFNGHGTESERLMKSLNHAPKWIYRLLWIKHRLYSRGTYLMAPFNRKISLL